MKFDTWHDCAYDATLGEWFAITMDGSPVFGETEHECEEHLREANRVYIAHCKKCPTSHDGQHWQDNARRLRDGL